jgi:hypothetical protein
MIVQLERGYMYYRSAQFSYDAKSKVFSADISELTAGRSQFLGQIYPDAADEGLVLISDRTGQEARFYLNVIDIDPEGDYKLWELFPTPESVRKQPGLRGVRVLIFND